MQDFFYRTSSSYRSFTELPGSLMSAIFRTAQLTPDENIKKIVNFYTEHHNGVKNYI